MMREDSQRADALPWWLDPAVVRADRLARRRAAGLSDEIEDEEALSRFAALFAAGLDDAENNNT